MITEREKSVSTLNNEKNGNDILEETRQANHKRWMVLRQLHREWNLYKDKTDDKKTNITETSSSNIMEDTNNESLQRTALKVELQHTTPITTESSLDNTTTAFSCNVHNLDFGTELVESYNELYETNKILQEQIHHETCKLQEMKQIISQQYQIQQQLESKMDQQKVQKEQKIGVMTTTKNSFTTLPPQSNDIDSQEQQDDRPDQNSTASLLPSNQQESLQDENQWLRSELAYISQCYEAITTTTTNQSNINTGKQNAHFSPLCTTTKKRKKIEINNNKSNNNVADSSCTTNPQNRNNNWSLDELVLKLMNQYLESSSSNTGDPYLLPREQHLPIDPKHIELLKKCHVIQEKDGSHDSGNIASSSSSSSSLPALSPSWIRLVDYLE